jgi:predicted nucleotidyltransferase
LQSVHARLRNVPEGIPFILDAETLKRGLNFTFTTDIGDLDLLGEVRGVGNYTEVLSNSITVNLFGYRFHVIDISRLIIAKRAAGRPKDLIALPELEAIQQAQALTDKKQ